MTEERPLGVPLPLPQFGYVTPEELTARINQRNQDPDGPGWGSVEDSINNNINNNSNNSNNSNNIILIIITNNHIGKNNTTSDSSNKV